MQLQTSAGTSFNNYVAGSADAKGAVLLIHEWWGLNDRVRTQADHLTQLGYRVLAIDLYDDKITTDAELAGKLMQGINQSAAKATPRNTPGKQRRHF